MCHAVVLAIMIGFTGRIDLQFIDGCPKEKPAACWLKFNEDHYGTRTYGVCVDDNKRVLYKGRLGEMVDT